MIIKDFCKYSLCFFLLVACLLVVVSCQYDVAQSSSRTLVSSADNISLEPVFCPSLECESSIISLIDDADYSVDVMIYSFTLEGLADALVRAKDRGVSVRVIIDKQQAGNQYAQDEYLLENGVSLVRDTNSRLMHNKVVIIDGRIVVTGSFNWSKNARDYNDENVLIVWSEDLAVLYTRQFEKLWYRDSFRKEALA